MEQRCELWLTVVVRKDQHGQLLQSPCNLIVWSTMLPSPMGDEHQCPEKRDKNDSEKKRSLHVVCSLCVFSPGPSKYE